MVGNSDGAGNSRFKEARRLAEEALEAERRGDADRAEELFGEASRVDPQAVQAVLDEDDVDRVARGGLDPDAVIGVEQEAPAANFEISLVINGKLSLLEVDASTTLLDALRDRLHLTGTKRGCDLGQCGACTVLLDDRRINACLTLAVMVQNRSVTTIEGLMEGGKLHPLQQAFIDHDAFQCGYCTPGQIMSAAGLIAEGRATSGSSIREHMSGNLCRCGAYPNIVAAVTEVARGET